MSYSNEYGSFHDAADDVHSIVEPEYPAENFQDLLKGIIDRNGSKHLWPGVQSLLAEFESQKANAYQSEKSLVEFLRRFVSSPSPLLDAHCHLWQLNKNPLSIVAVAKLLGITKAAVSKRKTYLEDFYKVKARCGRSADACEKFSRITKARGKRNHKGTPWKQSSNW